MKDKAAATLENILRQKAEELLQKKSINRDKHLTDIEIFKLVHELDINQIELEMQNEELTSAMLKAEIDAQKYTNLYDFAPSGYFTLSKKGEIIELNFRGATLLGKERSFLQNKQFVLYVADESEPTFNLFLEKLFDSKTKQTCEILLSKKSAFPTYVILSGFVSEDDDQCVITMHEISQRKKAEQTLKKSQLLLQSTLESQVDTIIFSIDKEYKYLSFNKAHSDIMKISYNADINVGLNILDCITSIEDRKVAKENYDRALAGETHSNIRVYGDIEKAHFESFFNPIVDINQQIIGATGLARNITKRIQNQENLRISEEKYRTLFESNRDSITIFRIDKDGKPGKFIEVNPATKSIFGYTKKEVLAMNVKDIEIVSDTKKESRIAALRSKGKIDFETIIKDKNGNQRNVEIETIVINYLNEPAVMCITRDITERKQNEENTKKAQGNLTTILEAIPDLLFELDLQGKIYYYQGHRNDLLYVPESEFLNKRFDEIIPLEAANVCIEAIQEASAKGLSTGKQYSINLPQGKHWFELTVSPIKETRGKDQHFIMLARDITARKKAENSLLENKENLQSIFDSVTEAIYIMDENGTFLDVNKGAEDMYQYTREELIGKTPYLVAANGLNDLEEVNRISKSVFETGIPITFEFWAVRKNGEVFPKEIVINKGNYFSKEVLIVTARDITVRKEAEEKLKVEKERIRTILELVGNPIFLQDNEHRVTYANSSFCSLFGLDEKSVIGKTLAENLPENEREHFLKIDRQVLDTGVTAIREETLTIKDKSHTIIASKTRFIDAAGNKSLVGSIYDITERKKTQEALQKSQEKLQGIFNVANSGIVLIDNSGNFLLFNDWCCKLLGYTRSEFLALNSRAISHPDDLEASDALNKKIIEGKIDTYQIEKRYIRKDKSFVWCEVSASAIKDHDNNVVNIIGIVNDITERIKNKKALEKSQEKLRGVFDLANSGIILTDLKGKFLLFNSWFHEALGYTREELNKLNRDVLTHPDDLENSIYFFNKLIEGKIDRFQIEKRFIRKDKSCFWAEVSVSAIKDKNNKVVNTVRIINDITEKRSAKIALQESEARLIETQALAKVGSWETDFTFENAIWSKETARIYGIDENATHFTLEEFLTIIHPDDRLLVQSTFVHSIKKNSLNTFEHRIITPSGVEKFVEQRWIIIRDTQDQPQLAVGSCHDITERKKSEELVKESKTRFSSIINSSPVAIALNDQQLNITYLNDAFVTMFGYTLEDIPTVEDWFTKAYPKPNYRKKISKTWVSELQKIKKNGADFVPTEVIVRCKDGSDKTVIASVNPLLQTHNREYLVNFYDITERKQAEVALENEKRRLAVILIGTSAGTWEWNVQTGAAVFNEQWGEIIGYTLEELAPHTMDTWRKHTHPEDLKYSENMVEKHCQGKIDYYESEFRMKHKNGEWVWILDRGKINKRDLDGKPLLISGTHLDITERKLAEEKLIASERLLQQTQTIANLGSYSLDFTSGKWTSTAVLDKIFGIDARFEKTIEGWISVIHPEWQTIMREYFDNAVIGNNINFNKEYKIIKVDSHEERWVHGMGEITLSNDDHLIGLIGSVQDITERKKAENNQEKTLNLFNNITSRLPGVVYQYLLRADGSSCLPYASDGIKQIFDLYPSEVKEDASKIFERIHPDDYAKVVASVQKSAKDLSPWQQEFCVNLNNGAVHHFLGNSSPQKLDDDSILWHGYIADITEKKIIENSLRESEEKYRSLVENSPDAVVIYIDDKIAFINNEGLKMLGAKNEEEIIGKPVLQFIHPESFANVISRMEEVVLDNNASEIVEERFLDLKGMPFDVELKAIPTVYKQQAAIQVIVHDITKRKQSALELNKINRVYALISQINNLIIRTRSQDELFQEICNIAVNFGKFRMSWIGLLNEDQRITTAAFAGYEKGYFSKRNITTIQDAPEGRGPTGTALREGRTVFCNDITNDPMMKPWRKDALERGYLSVISIPIIVRNKIIGAFNLYAEESNFFSSEEEITLLEKIILNISFALEKIQIEEDRKQTEDKIRQLSQAVEQSPVSIVITNTKGEIEYANPKFFESTGYTIDDILGKNSRFLKSGFTSAEDYRELWQTIVAGNEWHGEFQNKRKNGTLFWESATISPIINIEGKTTHFIAIKEDITRRKIVENELVKSKERAEESDRLKLAFLANMSHEIRTPMNGILGFTELLKAPKLSGEEQREYIDIIEKSGKRMLNIINDIISISKVESGQIEVSLAETNINEQVEYIHTFFKLEAKLKGIELLISKPLSSKDTFIKTDREKVYAVLTNLVKNAIKFTNEGTIEFGCEKKGKHLEFFIKDTGLGISKNQKKIIFERFRQANESVSRTHEGSGLGLAISKAYIEMLGGKIWVDSKVGKGSSFYFTIPFHSGNKIKENNYTETPGSAVKHGNIIKNLKVLIVEDDAISKLLVTIAVKPYSKEIIKVSTGFEAIEACRNNPDIDLVMMDINMPKMGGYEATKLIRKFNKDLVIIAQTANGMQSDRDNAIASGCTDYISKPINITSLGDMIQKYFSKSLL